MNVPAGMKHITGVFGFWYLVLGNSLEIKEHFPYRHNYLDTPHMNCKIIK